MQTTSKRARLRSAPTIADKARAFGSVDAMLDKLGQGWIHAKRGNPVFRNPGDGKWYDIPAALAGWVDVWQRLARHYQLELDLNAIARLGHRLGAGMPITPDDVARCVAVVTACKRAYRHMDVATVRSIANTATIAIKVEEMGLCGNA